ncbi:MAG: DUF4184 family protein [Micropruina sp.]|uniref:DUF4184 family protein n=1 Tax=Micropruina sp. TaxID=2737536 RepID=UPI0039E33F67
MEKVDGVPFTFFHPAAVVGLLRVAPLVPAGLIIGAMSPDFEYFLRLDTRSAYTHTIPGLIYACVPLGLLALVLWQGVIRGPLVSALPALLRERVGWLASSGVPRTARAWWWSAVSVLIGAATHLLWDSFTHPIFAPAQWLGLTAWSPVPGMRWTSVLQRVSDLIGLTVLVIVVARLPRRPVPAARRPWRFWLATAVTMAALVGVRTAVDPGWVGLSAVVATLISGCLLGVLAASIWSRVKNPDEGAFAG